VLQKLLGELDLEGVLIQADALHTQQAFLSNTLHCRGCGL
jgi:predicted transposase YbfD/YdcC